MVVVVSLLPTDSNIHPPTNHQVDAALVNPASLGFAVIAEEASDATDTAVLGSLRSAFRAHVLETDPTTPPQHPICYPTRPHQKIK